MSFYSSGQQRLAINTKERRMEQANGDKQQARVYAKISADQGDIEMADRYAKIGMSIVGNIARTEVPITNKQGGIVRQTVLEHVKSMIDTGTLSQWWDAIKRIPPKKLSPKARVVQSDIKHNADLKAVLNEKLAAIQTSKMVGGPVDEMIQDALDTLTGGDQDIEQELDGTASEFLGSAHGSDESLNTTTQGTLGKALKAEQDLSGMNLKPNQLTDGQIRERVDEYISKPPTKDKWYTLINLSLFRESISDEQLAKILSSDDIKTKLMTDKGLPGKVLQTLQELDKQRRSSADRALGRA